MRALLAAVVLLGIDGGALPGPDDGFTFPAEHIDAGTHVHCWHESPLQHAVPFHRDVHCCGCAAAHCIHLVPPDRCDGSHGPRCRYPSLDLKRPPE